MSDICKNDGTYFNQWGVCETCGNTRAKQDAVEASVQPETPVQPQPQPPAPVSNFCMKCGNRLNGAAFCSSCGTPAGQRGAVATVSTAAATTTAAAQPSPFVLLLKEAWGYVKAFFTSNPFAAIQNAALAKSHLWAVIGTVICLISALGFFAVFAQELDGDLFSYLGVNLISVIAAIAVVSSNPEALYSDSDKYENMSELLESNAAIFFSTLFIVIFVYFAFSALLKGFFAITKKNVSFVTVLNIQAVALMPFATSAVIAAVAAFISPLISLLVMLLGTLFSYIYLYFGIQKAATYTKSPYWLYAVLVVAHYVAIYLVVLLFYAIFC